MIFRRRGNAQQYFARGWSEPEENHVWTSGENSRLAFMAAEPASDIVFDLDAMPYVVRDILPKQRLNLYINFARVDCFELERPSRLSCSVPKRLFVGGVNIVDLHLPDARSPNDLGEGVDTSVLGLAVASASLTPT